MNFDVADVHNIVKNTAPTTPTTTTTTSKAVFSGLKRGVFKFLEYQDKITQTHTEDRLWLSLVRWILSPSFRHQMLRGLRERVLVSPLDRNNLHH